MEDPVVTAVTRVGHTTHASGVGAHCQDCDWMYMPGCGHNAERNSYAAALNHEREHNEPAMITVSRALAIIDAERASWGTLQDNEQAWAAVSRIRAAIESS